jgi:hypothetical protein
LRDKIVNVVKWSDMIEFPGRDKNATEKALLIPSDQRPSYPSGSDWIEYADAPACVADRAQYELLLASCREDWETTRDPQALMSARAWALMHRQWPPAWLNEAIDAALLMRRGKLHDEQYLAEAKHRLRWLHAKHIHDRGASWEDAWAEASDRLKATLARGSAETMKRSYSWFQRKRRAHPASAALMDQPPTLRPRQG